MFVYRVNTMTFGLRPLRIVLLGALLLLGSLAVRAADNWTEVRSPHFTVRTNAGEKEARKVADQFEQIRQMFHSAFSTLRVDPAQPVIIVAAKNENTLKLYLPEEWEVKGHIHHAGMYQQGEDKDYVVLRLDTEGENPFHTIYHEYTHALLGLNFSNLPLWLNEGLAEFFGNSTLGEKEVKTGTIDSGHLYLLNQSKLIPIETLLEVEYNSPYYNETNRASVFYAESWAMVHYLLMNPEARQKELLKNFLSSWQNSGDQVKAAREAFGDLKQFGKKIEAYSRQARFQIGIVKIGQEAASKNYAVRSLSSAEVLASRGDFFGHHNRLDQALPVLEEATKMEPTLAMAREALGYCQYRRRQIEEADKDMTEAIKLGTRDFAAHYFHGMLLLQKGDFSPEIAKEATGSLEKAIQLNPEFAPAFEELAHLYSISPETQKQAVNAAIKAVQLDPATLSYSINLAFILANSNRLPEARAMAQRIRASSVSPAEKEMASDLFQRIEQAEKRSAEEQAANSSASAQNGAPSQDSSSTARPAEALRPKISQEVPIQLKHRVLAAEGPVSSADCSEKREIFLNVDMRNGPVTFHSTDMESIALTWADGVPEPSIKTCAQWKGRRVKVWFSPTPGREYAGEISKLFFF